MRNKAAAVLLCVLALALSASASDEILKRADQLSDQGRMAQARAEYERAIKAGQQPQIERSFTRAQNLGLNYLNGTPQDLAKAAQWLEIAWRLQPQSDLTRFYLAQALTWGGKHEEAAVHLRALADAKPANADFTLALANALYQGGKAEDAFAVLKRFVEHFPSNQGVRVEFARLLSYSKRYTESLSQYQAVLQADPRHLGAAIGIAKVTSWQGHLDLALQLFDRVLARQPNNAEAQVGKGFTLMWMGRNEEARSLLQAAQRRNPRDAEIRAALKELGPAPAPARAAEPAQPAAPEPAVVAEAQPEPPPVVQPVEPPAPPQPTLAERVAEIMAAAETAAAQNRYVEAVHHYHRALELDPANAAAKLQIARVLSWSREWEAAIQQYSRILLETPQHAQARAERARVQSWAQHYEQSLADYEIVLRQAETGGADGLQADELRLEYARVLAWSKRYDDSVLQMEALLSREQPVERQRTILLEYARVLSWAREYQRSIAAYDRLLALGDSREARLGKAQVMFWSGNLRQASVMLTALEVEAPRDPEVSFSLAAVESAQGRLGRSLYYLQFAPDNADTASLRSGIRDRLRPVLRFRFGHLNDRETPAIGTGSSLKLQRYTTALEFNIHPDVRMEVVNAVSRSGGSNPSLTRHGGIATGVETLARISFRASDWLQLTIGAGEGDSGGYYNGAEAPRARHILYDVRPVVTVGDWRADLAFSRRVADYTPRAVHESVTHRRESVALSRHWNQRLRAGGEFFHATYDLHAQGGPQLSTEALGAAAWVNRTITLRDGLEVTPGARYDTFSFDSGARAIADPLTGIGSGGFFTPRAYHRVAATGVLNWTAAQHLALQLNGTFGPQRITGLLPTDPDPKFSSSGSLGVEAAFPVGRTRPYLRYDFFSTVTQAASAGTGSYRSNVFSFGFSHRF